MSQSGGSRLDGLRVQALRSRGLDSNPSTYQPLSGVQWPRGAGGGLLRPGGRCLLGDALSACVCPQLPVSEILRPLLAPLWLSFAIRTLGTITVPTSESCCWT